jgi:hypothetical protein
MRFMNLPELPVGPHSLEDCIRVYLKRLPADDAPVTPCLPETIRDHRPVSRKE